MEKIGEKLIVATWQRLLRFLITTKTTTLDSPLPNTTDTTVQVTTCSRDKLQVRWMTSPSSNSVTLLNNGKNSSLAFLESQTNF